MSFEIEDEVSPALSGRYAGMGERLRAERERLGFTLEEMAERSGIGLGMLYLLEKGLKKVSAKELALLAELGVSSSTVLELDKVSPLRWLAIIGLTGLVIYLIAG